MHCGDQWWIKPRGGGGANDWPSGTSAPWSMQTGCLRGIFPLRSWKLNFWTQFAQFSAYSLSTLYWKSFLILFPIINFYHFHFFLLQVCDWCPCHNYFHKICCWKDGREKGRRCRQGVSEGNVPSGLRSNFCNFLGSNRRHSLLCSPSLKVLGDMFPHIPTN